MSRLLFAAARGARIQFFAEQSHRYEWMHIERVPIKEQQQGFYRIHPDDAHLAYGSISTALREQAIIPPPHVYALQYHLEFYVSEHLKSGEQLWHGDDLHRSLFLLILAETLADEGL